MTSTNRWLSTAALSVGTFVSLTLGATSDGPRGLMLGLVVPALCVAAIAVVRGLGWAFLAAVAAGVAGPAAAMRVGGNLDDSPDAVINLLPILIVPLLIGAAYLGLLCQLAGEWLADHGSRRRTTGSGSGG